MNLKTIAFIFLVISTTKSIFLTIKTNNARCLCQYIVDSNFSHDMKFQISFPQIDNIQMGQHFLITIKNTQTDDVKMETVKPGSKYVKEFQQLTPNVIYEVCIALKSQRSLELIIQYESQTMYNSAHNQIKVPQSLLKKSDMKQAFLSASYLTKILEQYTQQQKFRDKQQSQSFLEVQKLNHKLTLLSGIQITVIIGISLYQFFTLKNYLSTKQYI